MLLFAVSAEVDRREGQRGAAEEVGQGDRRGERHPARLPRGTEERGSSGSGSGWLPPADLHDLATARSIVDEDFFVILTCEVSALMRLDVQLMQRKQSVQAKNVPAEKSVQQIEVKMETPVVSSSLPYLCTTSAA